MGDYFLDFITEKWIFWENILSFVSIDPYLSQFRSFVYNNQMTGITQYHEGTYIPEILEKKEQILASIMNVFEQVKEKLPFSLTSAPYTLDFAVCPKTLRCWIIEINNPPPKVRREQNEGGGIRNEKIENEKKREMKREKSTMSKCK